MHQKDITSRLLKVCDLLNRTLYNEAEEECLKLLTSHPQNIDAILQSARMRYGQLNFSAAAEILEKGFIIAPNHRGIRFLLLASYKDAHNYQQMLRVAKLFQTSSDACEQLLAYSAYLNVCDWHAAKKLETTVLDALKKGNIETSLLPSALLMSNGLTDISPELQYQIHKQWAKHFSHNQTFSIPKQINGRIRIAYVSGDFRRHPVGYFMLQIIESHHRNEFEVFCYAQLEGKDDDVSEIFKQSTDHFIDISNMDDQALNTQIRADGIHIAVDLASHTTPSRIIAFTLRPAPVQISYLGYPNTSGLKEIDYHITDHFAEDTVHGTKYSEELLFMPKSFLCYGMEWTEERTTTSPCEKTGTITFASFNDGRKLNLEVIETWSKILNRVKHSRLLLKFYGTSEPIIQKNIHAAFAKHDIAKDRVELLNRTTSISEHILAYHHVDIALDPFPYTGTTTTCEALSQGVPVITLVGSKHSNRVSYSILKNIGFEETITFSTEEYITKAVQLANNPKGLSVLRGCLPLLLQHSPLRQNEQFITDMESLYKDACIRKGISLNPHSSTNIQEQPPT